MNYRSSACAMIVVALAFTGCATTNPRAPSRPPAQPAPHGPPALPAPPTLVRDIDAILSQPALQHGSWGVLVKSIDKDDETLYARNPLKLMLPASNMKIVTLAAAAEKLGWDYRYETTV